MKHIAELSPAPTSSDVVRQQLVGNPNLAPFLIGLLATFDLEVDEFCLQVHLRPA
jgi:hypothetical protein